MVTSDDEIKVIGEMNDKDSPDDFFGCMYDTDDDASISDKSSEFIGWDWPEKDSPSTEVNWQDDLYHENKEVIFTLVVYEEIVEEVIEIANDQDEAVYDQEVDDDSLDDERLKKEDQARGLESPKKIWSRMKSQRRANKDLLV
ncbi:hypothetical protein Tco_0783550 [Tanacetum coccineum]